MKFYVFALMTAVMGATNPEKLHQGSDVDEAVIAAAAICKLIDEGQVQ